MNFRSDNESPISPAILGAIEKANIGMAYSYGEDLISQRLLARFSELFEHEVEVFPVATGTAANALAISQLTPVYGSVFCHEMAHLYSDECGAPEFFTGGAKIVPLSGELAKIDIETLEDVMGGVGDLGVHETQASAVSISQSTELGTIYKVHEVQQLAKIAHSKGLGFHMDGARFANVIQSLGCTPAEMTWKAGVDILSFGATKNGALAAEAVIVFNQDRVQGLDRRHKRAGHLFSKMRYISAQLETYIKDGLWLELAAHANKAADALSKGFYKLSQYSPIEVLYPVEVNEIFVKLPESVAKGLKSRGYEFHHWPGTRDVYRLVTSFFTDLKDVQEILLATKELCDLKNIDEDKGNSCL